MSRAILPDAQTPASPAVGAPESTSAAAGSGAGTAPALPSEPQDTLAGALPAWDLLPASPFIRRVK